MPDVLGWLAMIISWLALYLCGKYRIGWMISVLVWLLWFPYGLMIHSVPVMINTSVYAAVSAWNWYHWNRDHETIQDRDPN